MVPPTAVFSPASLEERLQCDSRGKRRKQPVDLAECELRRLVQYDCRVPDRRDRRAPAVCWPLERLFRRCAGGLTVETTALEEGAASGDGAEGDG